MILHNLCIHSLKTLVLLVSFTLGGKKYHGKTDTPVDYCSSPQGFQPAQPPARCQGPDAPRRVQGLQQRWLPSRTRDLLSSGRGARHPVTGKQSVLLAPARRLVWARRPHPLADSTPRRAAGGRKKPRGSWRQAEPARLVGTASPLLP